MLLSRRYWGIGVRQKKIADDACQPLSPESTLAGSLVCIKLDAYISDRCLREISIVHLKAGLL